MGEAPVLLESVRNKSWGWTADIDLLPHHNITTGAGHGSHRWSTMVTRFMFSLSDATVFAKRSTRLAGFVAL